MTEEELQQHVKTLVPRLVSSPDYRMTWMEDPVRNLCASVGLEKARHMGVTINSSSWKESAARFNAVVDALYRMCNDMGMTGARQRLDGGFQALIFIEPGSSTAWTVAVVLAAVLERLP